MQNAQLRRNIIQGVMLLVAIIWVGRLAYMQLIDKSFAVQADATTRQRIFVYPSRGLIMDRKERVLVNNQATYDVMVTYDEVKKNLDTARFCQLLNIDKPTFIHCLHRDFKADKGQFNRKVAYPFLRNISYETYARLQESLYRFPGFFIQQRNVRAYPEGIAAHALGYIGEVNDKQIEESGGYYARGDYVGASGLEKSYDRVLAGRRGIHYLLRDNLGRAQEKLSSKVQDSAATPGCDLVSTLDLDLQAFAETLMANKKGSLVAIEPSTGEVLAMVSGPTYDPSLLTITRGRGAAFRDLLTDPNNPILNRAITARYPPGSIFKTGMSLVGMQTGIWDPERGVTCAGGYRLSARKKVGCHSHPSARNISQALQMSCNTYFCTVFKAVAERYGFNDTERGLDSLVQYLHEFGFGRPLGIDFPNEPRGNIPTSQYYNKQYGKGGWHATTVISMGIGQGEVLLTPIQMANLSAMLANRGYYYTPHLSKSLRDAAGKTILPDKKYREKHQMRIDDHWFDYVHNGMEAMATNNANVHVPDIRICGKTGTAQNPHGKDHSAFICFAPRENPKIAIACFVENAGFGAQFAAPIASLCVEKYLTDTIRPSRQALLAKMRKMYLLKKFTRVAALDTVAVATKARNGDNATTSRYTTPDGSAHTVAAPTAPTTTAVLPLAPPQPQQPAGPLPAAPALAAPTIGPPANDNGNTKGNTPQN